MSASAGPACGSVSLREGWELRNAAATTLIKTEEHFRRMLEAADAEQIVGLLEAFSPARSTGPEWTRTFDLLAERLWAWCDEAILAAVEAEFRGRGAAWLAVANALTPEWGQQVRAQVGRHLTPARLPAFSLG